MRALPEPLRHRLQSTDPDVVFAAIDEIATDARLSDLTLKGLTWRRSRVPGEMGYRRGDVLGLLDEGLATAALHRLVLQAPDTQQASRVRSRVTHLYLDADIEVGSALAGLTELEDLRLTGVRVTAPAALGGLQTLRRLWLTRVRLPEGLDGVGRSSSLRSVHLIGCDLTRLGGLGGCASLEHLELVDCPKLVDLSALFGSHGLRSLHVAGFAGTRLGVLPHGLSRLEVERAPALADLHGLEGCTALRWLRIAGAPVSRLLTLAACADLEHVVLEDLAVDALAPLGSLPRLAQLELVDLPALADLHGLEDSVSLEVLEVASSGLARWRGLPASPRWVRVQVRDCLVGGLDLPPVTLPELTVRDCPRLRTSTGLGRVTGLRHLDLRGCDALADADGLVEASPGELWLNDTGLARRDVPQPLRGRSSWAREPA